VAANLTRIIEANMVTTPPNLWQLELGVLRMWHRILFRSDTIGLSGEHPVCPGWCARLFRNRAIRLPFLLFEGSVVPWDLSGLLSTPETLMCHLLGTHHDGAQFVYDLEILDLVPGQREELHRRAREVVKTDDPRSRWLRDLCVYENYHETLDKQEPALDERYRNDPDIAFEPFLEWCARQPATPGETWRAWRRGEFRFAKDAA
jgi:hypothetical protein